MKKAKHSLVRIERVDGETVCLSFTGDDPEELIAMLGDGLAEVLHVYPQHHRGAKCLVRRVFRDYLPDWVQYWLDGLPFTIVGVGILTGVIYGLSYVAHWLGVV